MWRDWREVVDLIFGVSRIKLTKGKQGGGEDRRALNGEFLELKRGRFENYFDELNRMIES